jgi:hypothetical protein
MVSNPLQKDLLFPQWSVNAKRSCLVMISLASGAGVNKVNAWQSSVSSKSAFTHPEVNQKWPGNKLERLLGED